MTSTPTEPTTDPGTAPGSDPAGQAPPKPGDETGKQFTQADLDRVLRDRLADQQRKHEAALEQVKGDADKSETQRLEAERDRANDRAEQAAQKAGPRVAKAEAQLVAITAGGRPDRAAAIVKQADLDGVVKFDGDDWTVDTEKLNAAVTAVLEEYPEWKAEAEAEGKKDDGKGSGSGGSKPSASGGDLGGGSGDAVTLDDFVRMNLSERSRLADEKPDEYRRLADAEIAAKAKRG